MIETTKIKKGVQKAIKKLDFRSVNIVYKSTNNTYRGFVLPYAITYEAPTQKEVKEALKEMVVQYELGLERYGNPEHLKHIPLSDEEDKEKLNMISPELFTELSKNQRLIIRPSYYAEAKLPA